MAQARKLTDREIAALRVIIGQHRTYGDSVALRLAVGRAPRLAAGALCRKGLVDVNRDDPMRPAYVATDEGRAVLSAIDGRA